jgi:putative ABC transport system permease protein
MLKNYFKVALRNLLHNKAFAFLNIVGLAIGMATAILIGLWLKDELGYNHYYANHKRLGQVLITQKNKDDIYTGSTIAMPLGAVLDTRFKELFKKVALVSFHNLHVLASGYKKIPARGLYAQPAFPGIFALKIENGQTGALKDPSTFMIAHSVAVSLFGNANAVNKTILLDNKVSMKIGAVYEDLPENTNFAGTVLILPWSNPQNSYMTQNTNWHDHNGELYVELNDQVSAAQATEKIKNIPTPFIKGWDETAMVYPLDKMHLYGEFRNGKPSGGRIQYVVLLGIIGAFVLFLACINFMNLSTARSSKRAKEVGIRKTIGSLSIHLIGQFLIESVLLTFIAFGIALLAAQLSLSFFNTLSGKHMNIPFQDPVFWFLCLGFALFTGILAGSYPAFYLSRFEPIKVLKGAFQGSRYNSIPRQVLVVLQFTVSLSLIIGTIVVYRQISYAKDRPTGYTREGLITLPLSEDLLGKYDALRSDLLRTGAVVDMAESSQPITQFNNNNSLDWRGKDPNLVVFFRNVNVTTEFGSTVEWKITEGRDFSRAYADSSSLILSEAAVKITGIPHPVGEIMKFGGKSRTVIGVVKDMMTNSPYEAIEPSIFLGDENMSVITIRLKAGLPQHTAMAGIEKVFKKYNPGSPFIFIYNDEMYANKFAAEERVSNLSAVFAGLAIFISCLGLFGLVSFVAEQRTKEIGVRKVLGANIFSLWSLLSRQFIKLVLISLCIAVPLSYYGMNRWLQDYAYREEISWWIFGIAGLSILLITLITVSFQSLKAALMNPVKSLRSE